MTGTAQAGAATRTLAPPERRVARVLSNEPVGAYRVVAALDASGPADPQPGQFYMLAAERGWGGTDGRPYLPRAFSYARALRRDGGLRLEFLLEAVGPGTARLAELAPGEGLALVGPLGTGFREPGPDRRPLLVGGGIGTAPLVCLADGLEEPEVVLGFRSADHAQAARLFAREVALATDDGSAGRQALVTDLLRERLDADRAAEIYACGPPPMLEAVRTLATEQGVPAQLALEAGMACGYGACFGCAVPTREGYVRLCLEGPVLDAARLETALFPGSGH